MQPSVLEDSYSLFLNEALKCIDFDSFYTSGLQNVL